MNYCKAIQKCSQAWGFLLPSMTGPYSWGSSPYCDMVSPISAASITDDQIKDSEHQRVRMAVICTHTNCHEKRYIMNWPPCTSVWDGDGLLLLPFHLHMARAQIRNSESCVNAHLFLIEKKCGVCHVLRFASRARAHVHIGWTVQHTGSWFSSLAITMLWVLLLYSDSMVRSREDWRTISN